jgi:hypothetical protein
VLQLICLKANFVCLHMVEHKKIENAKLKLVCCMLHVACCLYDNIFNKIWSFYNTPRSIYLSFSFLGPNAGCSVSWRHLRLNLKIISKNGGSDTAVWLIDVVTMLNKVCCKLDMICRAIHYEVVSFVKLWVKFLILSKI